MRAKYFRPTGCPSKNDPYPVWCFRIFITTGNFEAKSFTAAVSSILMHYMYFVVLVHVSLVCILFPVASSMLAIL